MSTLTPNGNYYLEVSGTYLNIVFLQPLTTNRVYEVTVSAGVSGLYASGYYTLENDYTFWFTSLYCPLFTTPTKVKLQAGPSSEVFSDDTIYRMIHKNSMDAIDLYNSYHGTSLDYDEWGCTWHDVPFILRRYVECKTAYDILSLIKLMGNDTGNQLKTLGDMTIKYGNSPNEKSDPKKSAELYDCWQEALKSLRTVSVKTAVRGYNDSTKGFSHPTKEFHHNRVIRAVSFNNAHPSGPWQGHHPVNGYRW